MGKSLSRSKTKKASTQAPSGRSHSTLVASSTKGHATVVGTFVHERMKNGKLVSVSTLIRSLEAGLPVHELDDLGNMLELPMARLAPLLGISKATLHRRKAAGTLDVAESDRVVRFARLLGKAASVMESIENGRRWLMAPQVGLGGAVPLEYAQTEVGAREVEDLLGRIDYGVYS